MKRKQTIFGILAMGLIGVSLTLTARPTWAGPIPVTACNTHISLPGTYQLANSLSNCPKNGVVIEFTIADKAAIINRRLDFASVFA